MNSLRPSAGAAVGAQIKRLRAQRGLSGAELARRSGIGKASLSNIEAGQGNPTIDTLHAIAFALRLPLADLLAADVVDTTELVPGTPRDSSEVTRELLRRVTPGHTTEVWRLRMPPHTDLDGVPHAAGTTEHLLIAEGALAAGPTDERIDLVAGDFLTFRADVPHGYRTESVGADVTVFLVSPLLT